MADLSAKAPGWIQTGALSTTKTTFTFDPELHTRAYLYVDDAINFAKFSYDDSTYATASETGKTWVEIWSAEDPNTAVNQVHVKSDGGTPTYYLRLV